MKVLPNTIEPSKDGYYFILNHESYVGIACFEDGKWFIEPTKKELNLKSFFWIDSADVNRN